MLLKKKKEKNCLKFKDQILLFNIIYYLLYNIIYLLYNNIIIYYLLLFYKL